MKSCRKPSIILLDIEGTICPISFVKETLFPFALQVLPNIAAKRWDEDEFKSYVQAFPKEAQANPEALVLHVTDLTEKDVKVASLKNLQGYLWKTGFEDGQLVTPFFHDVAPSFREWADVGIRLAIYSSGSVAAQKLVLNYAAPGEGSDEKSQDLRPLISDYFDTVNAGHKTEQQSYTKIAQALKAKPEDVCFFTDVVKEAEAAKDAGIEAFLLVRPGNVPLSEEQQSKWKEKIIDDFTQLRFT